MLTEIDYTSNYINISRPSLLENVEAVVKKKRFKHIKRVEETALKLAEHYQFADLEKVSIAALMHDYCKDMPHKDMLTLAKNYVLDEPIEKESTSIWHSYAAAQLGRTKYDILDQDILDAISQHTIGAKSMSLLSKIVFVADYIEPGRDFPGVDKARQLAESSLDRALFYKIEHTLVNLVKKRRPIYLKSVDVYNHWLRIIEEETTS